MNLILMFAISLIMLFTVSLVLLVLLHLRFEYLGKRYDNVEISFIGGVYKETYTDKNQ